MSISDCGTGGRPGPRADCATNDSAITDARARSVARLLVGDVDQLLQAPLGREHRERGLHVDARVAGADVSGYGSAGGRPGSERAVDEQAPDLLEGDVADQVLDVDAAVAQRAALLVGLGDLGREGDDALEARLDLQVLLRPLPSALRLGQVRQRRPRSRREAAR